MSVGGQELPKVDALKNLKSLNFLIYKKQKRAHSPLSSEHGLPEAMERVNSPCACDLGEQSHDSDHHAETCTWEPDASPLDTREAAVRAPGSEAGLHRTVLLPRETLPSGTGCRAPRRARADVWHPWRPRRQRPFPRAATRQQACSQWSAPLQDNARQPVPVTLGCRAVDPDVR